MWAHTYAGTHTPLGFPYSYKCIPFNSMVTDIQDYYLLLLLFGDYI